MVQKVFYGDVEQPIPPNAPSHLANQLMFVCSWTLIMQWTKNKQTRCLQTTFQLYINNSPYEFETSSIIFWTLSFSMMVIVDTIIGIRYKLQMIGVTTTSDTHIYGEIKSITNDNTNPYSKEEKYSLS